VLSPSIQRQRDDRNGLAEMHETEAHEIANGSSLGEYARVIGELDGENEKISEDPARGSVRKKGGSAAAPGKEPSSEGGTS
jgi:hypothetical protein